MDILIIEPDHILAREYKKAFDTAKIRVRICNDAQKAVSLIDEKIPNAIILELQLRGHSGVEFLHELRSYEDWASILVFIHSNIPEHITGANNKTWDSFGVSRYFYKPKTTLNQLVGTVKEALSNNESA